MARKMTRQEVYDLIDGERLYQDTVVDDDPNRRALQHHSVGDYLTMMHHYMHIAMTEWTQNAGTKQSLANIRKIAGICVKCMEFHGAPERELK